MGRLAIGSPPAWLGNAAILVGIYFAVVFGLSHWLLAWHDWDWQVYDWLKPAPSALPAQIALVDMQYADPADIPQHRRLLATFIKAAAAQRPAAIILDIPFGQCQPAPCTGAMEASRTSLVQALDQAKIVYANVGKIDLTPEGLPNGSAAALDPDIYRHFAGYGHTAAIVVHDSEESGDLFYYPCYAAYPSLFGGAMATDVWALVDVALRSASSVGKICDQSERVAVRYGPLVPDRAPSEYQISAAAPFPRGVDFSGRYVIVGVPAFDRNERTSTRPGSELFAWIVADELSNAQFTQPAIAPVGSVLRFLVPLYSALVVLAFTACFLFLKRLPLGATRPLLPAVAAALAFCIGVAAFVAYESLSRVIQPQVALVTLGMFVAAILCGVRGWQIERDILNNIDDTAAPERYDYDVFVSYAHQEFDWVYANLYLPLKKAGLNVFFDRSAIRIGTSWQDRIALSIRHSRFVVAVYSEAYFSRPYCRYEIKRAHRKWVNAEDPLCVLPIVRGHVQIPESVDDIQARSFDEDPNLIAHVIDEIVARVAHSQPTSQTGGVRDL